MRLLSELRPLRVNRRVGVYCGELKNGMAYGEGKWTYQDERGTEEYYATWKDNKLHGYSCK